MLKRIGVVNRAGMVLGITGLLLIGIIAASCGKATSAAGGPSGRVRPILLTAAVQGDAMTLPLSKVQGASNTRFNVAFAAGTETFMAYEYNGKTYVRASICPPCQSRSFSLVGNTLVCDSCGTVFYAETGKGKTGACVAYPKQLVVFTMTDGNIVMKNADLLAAFQKTQNP